MDKRTLILLLAGVLAQMATVIANRKYAVSFWWLLPAVVAAQYWFMAAFTRAENFTVSWFLGTGLLAISALASGYFLFGDKVGIAQVMGVALILAGAAALNLR